MLHKKFQIGNFSFNMNYPDALIPPAHFMLFEKDDIHADWTFDLIESDSFPAPSGKLLAKRDDLEVYDNGTSETRLIGVNGTSGYYACLVEGDCSSTVYLDSGRYYLMQNDPVFTSLLALERHVMKMGNLILHCAYLNYKGSSILFSGPSGMGKSTQAALWTKYRDCEIINGDKSLLIKKDGIWCSSGWPVCGSSGICQNITMPIRAIVLLKQGPENSIMPLSGMQSFTGIYQQLTLNRWSQQAIQAAMNSIEDLISSIPIYQLTCTISEEAVDCLDSALQ